MWSSDPCYKKYGVDGSDCSFLIYLSEVETWCPKLKWRKQTPKSLLVNSERPKVQFNKFEVFLLKILILPISHFCKFDLNNVWYNDLLSHNVPLAFEFRQTKEAVAMSNGLGKPMQSDL